MTTMDWVQVGVVTLNASGAIVNWWCIWTHWRKGRSES